MARAENNKLQKIDLWLLACSEY